jgi:hypothetical protein
MSKQFKHRHNRRPHGSFDLDYEEESGTLMSEAPVQQDRRARRQQDERKGKRYEMEAFD